MRSTNGQLKSASGVVEQSQQLTDCSVGFIPMPERLIKSDAVAVLAADLFAFDDSARFKIGDDPLHGPLGDPDVQCHLAKHERWISRQQHQHVRVVRQVRPLDTGRFRRR